MNNKELVQRLIKELIKNDEIAGQRILDLFAKYESKGVRVSNWAEIKNRLFGISKKLRIHGIPGKAELLEHLVNKLFDKNRDLDTISNILDFLLRISEDIYIECEVEMNRNHDSQLFFSSEELTYPTITPTSIYSQIECPSRREASLMQSIKIDTFSSISYSPLAASDIPLIFTNNQMYNQSIARLNKVLINTPLLETPNFASPISEASENELTPMTEVEILYEILMMFTGSFNSVFIQMNGQILIKHPENSPFNEEIIFVLLNRFREVYYKYSTIRNKLSEHKTVNRVMKSFSLSLENHLKTFVEFIISKTEDLVNSAAKENLTLIKLYSEIIPFSEEFEIILNILNLISQDDPVYQCSLLISILYKFSEDYLLTYPFLLNSIFFNTFSEYVLMICEWMFSGQTSSELFLIKNTENKHEWESYFIKTISLNNKKFPCVPSFFTKEQKEILAIGNYHFIINKILYSVQLKDFFFVAPDRIHKTIMEKFKNLLENSQVQNIKHSIKDSFSLTIHEFFLSSGRKILKLLNENYDLMRLVKMLQQIYLLQDPEFLEFFTPVIKSLREKQQFDFFSDKLNAFFMNSSFSQYFSCEYLNSLNSISDIKIKFTIPEVLEFVFDGTVEIYQKIFRFLLEIKLASGSIKTLNKEYDWIVQRVQYVHFMNCFEYYSGQSTLHNILYTFNKSDPLDVYALKKLHKKMISLISKKLFISDLVVIGDNIKNIFKCFNTIYYLNFVNSRFDNEVFYEDFNKNLSQILNLFRQNKQNFNSEDYAISEIMIGFNRFYQI